MLIQFLFGRMKTGIVLEEEHTKLWNVQKKLGFWSAKYHVSLIYLLITKNIFILWFFTRNLLILTLLWGLECEF